jgi:hypothetical protein
MAFLKTHRHIFAFLKQHENQLIKNVHFSGGFRHVRYHDDWSKKLNACILLLSHMVYLYPKHNVYQMQVYTCNNTYICALRKHFHNAAPLAAPLFAPLFAHF